MNKFLLQILCICICATSTRADLVKCLNEKGEIAFSNIQCPPGFKPYGVEAESERNRYPSSTPSYSAPALSSAPATSGSPRPDVDAEREALGRAIQAEESRQADLREAERRRIVELEKTRLEAMLEKCPPLTEWKSRMACQDRINRQLKELQSNSEQYLYNRAQAQAQETSRKEQKSQAAVGAINPRTGEFYPASGEGVINPRTGAYYPRSGSGFINPQTGEYFPGQ